MARITRDAATRGINAGTLDAAYAVYKSGTVVLFDDYDEAAEWAEKVGAKYINDWESGATA